MGTVHFGTPLRAVASTDLKRTARTTGLFYLGLAISGIFGTLLVRAQLYEANDPTATLSNLLAHQSLARLGIALELGIVLTQALTAIWFYRLFRSIETFAAGLIAVFGIVNAAAILGSAAMLTTALAIADDPISLSTAGTATNVQLLYLVSEHLWVVAGLFFGLWLIPMGLLATRSGWLPGPLGWLLVAGGIAYIGGAFAGAMFPDNTAISQLLTVPATLGEVWIIGYLLFFGIHQHTSQVG